MKRSSWQSLLVLGVAFTTLNACGGKNSKNGAQQMPSVSAGGEEQAKSADDDAKTEQSDNEPSAYKRPTVNPAALAALGITKTEQCRYQGPPALPKEVQEDLEKGLAKMREADSLADAQRRFDHATKVYSSAYPAWFNLGVIAIRQGDERKATENFEKALAARKDYVPAWKGLLSIAARHRAAKGQLERLGVAAREFPTNLDLQGIYVEELALAKDFDRGWKVARTALGCDERHVGVLSALVKLSRAQGRDQLANAILDQAQAIDPNNAELFVLRADQLAEESEHLQDAMRALQQAVAANPDYVEARTELGIRYLNAGNYTAALEQLSAAARLLPTSPSVFVNLGEAYRANQRWSDAQAAYEKAIAMDDHIPAAHLGLGLLWMASADVKSPEAEIPSLQKASAELKTYRAMLGSKLSKNDPTEYYLANLQRRIERAERTLARQKRAQETKPNDTTK